MFAQVQAQTCIKPIRPRLSRGKVVLRPEEEEEGFMFANKYTYQNVCPVYQNVSKQYQNSMWVECTKTVSKFWYMF